MHHTDFLTRIHVKIDIRASVSIRVVLKLQFDQQFVGI